MELETNATRAGPENSFDLETRTGDTDAVVKDSAGFPLGTNDIDAMDFAELFLRREQTDRMPLNELYVLVNFRRLLRNWHDCGVARATQHFWLPPFFRRVAIRRPHLSLVDSAPASPRLTSMQPRITLQLHAEPGVRRDFNEEVSNLLKRKIKATVSKVDELGVTFDYDGEVTAEDAGLILEKVAAMNRRALDAAERAAHPERREALRLFAANLQKSFYAFEPDFFQQNLLRIVDDVVNTIKGSIELWPTLVEICYFEKERRGLPRRKVNSRRRAG